MKEPYLKLLILLIPLIFFSVTTKVSAVPAPTSELSDTQQLKLLLQDIKSFQADFEQTIFDNNNEVTRTLIGKLQIQQPGLLNWQIMSPEARIIMVDGKKIWDYDVELSQVIVKKINDNLNFSPLYFLSGNLKQLDKQFKIKKIQTYEYDLFPVMNDVPFQWVRLLFAEKKLIALEWLDNLGFRSMFKFTNIIKNQNISPKHFKFTLPDGVDVLEE